MDKKGITRILTGMLFLSPLVSEAWKYSTCVEEVRGNWKFTKNMKDWGDNPIDEGREDKDVYEGSRSVVISKLDVFGILAGANKKGEATYIEDRQMWLAETSSEGGAQGKGVKKDGNTTTMSKGTRFTYYKHPTIYVSKGNPKDCSMEAAFYDRIKSVKGEEKNVSIWFPLKFFKDEKSGQSVILPAVPLFFPLSTKGKVGDVPMSKLVFDEVTRNAFTARANEPCLDFSNTPIVHIDLGMGKATYKGKGIDAQQSIEFYMLPETVSEVCFHPAMALHHAGLLQEEFSSIEYEFSFAGDMTTGGIKNWPDNVETMSLINSEYKGSHDNNKLTAYGLSRVSCSGNNVMTFAPSEGCEYHNGDTIGTTGVLLTGKMPKEDILRTMVVYNKDEAQKAFVGIHVFLPHATAMAMIKEICTGQLDGRPFTALDKPADELKAMVQILEKIKGDGAALPDNYDRVIEMVKWHSEDKDPFGDGTDEPKAKPKPKGDPVDFDKLTAEEIEKMSADRLNEVLNQYRDLKGGKGLEVVDAGAIKDLEDRDELTDGKTYAEYKAIKGKITGGTTGKTKALNYLQARLAVNDLLKDGKADNLNAAREKLRNLLGLKKPAGGGGGENGAAILGKLPADSDIKTKFDEFLGKADQKLKDAIAEINAKEITAKTDSAACVDGLDAKHSLPKDQLVKYVDFLKALKGYNDAKPIAKPMMLGALKGKLDEFIDFKPEETHDEPVKIWTEAEIDAEIKKIKDACTAFRGKHSDLDAAIKASVEAEPAKSVDDYIAERKTALGDAPDGAAITKLDQLKDQLDYYSMYKTCMDEAAKEDNKKPMEIPPPPGGKVEHGPSIAQGQLGVARVNLTELAKLLGDTIDFGGSTGGGGTPTGDKVWTWKQIDDNTNKFKANFQKFCGALKEGDFKNVVTEIDGLEWDPVKLSIKARDAEITKILEGKSGDLKALLEKYVACKNEVHKFVMPPPPDAPEPTAKDKQQVAIETAQENLKALAAHFKIDLGGGDDGGHHEPPPTGMTAEAAKAEIVNAENALKAAFGNDAAWENIANGTTINWTADDAAVQAAINSQPANLQPKLKAYYEYHKLMQEVLSATDAGRKTKLDELKGKIEGWKATLSKKDEEHHEDDAALLTGACGPKTWTKAQIAKGIADLNKALEDILNKDPDLKGVIDLINWENDGLSKKIEEVPEGMLRSKVEACCVSVFWWRLAKAKGEQKFTVGDKETDVFIAQRYLGVAQIGFQKLENLLNGIVKSVENLSDPGQQKEKQELQDRYTKYLNTIASLKLPDATSDEEKKNFAKEVQDCRWHLISLKAVLEGTTQDNYDGVCGSYFAAMQFSNSAEKHCTNAKMAYKLTEDQNNTIKDLKSRSSTAETGMQDLQKAVKDWNDAGKPAVDISAQITIIDENKKKLQGSDSADGKSKKQIGLIDSLNGFDYDDLLSKITTAVEAQEQALQAAKDASKKVSDEYNLIPEGVRTAIEKHNKTINGWDTQRNQFVTALGSINDDGIADEFKSSIADNKAKAQKALENCNAEIESIQNVLKTAKTEEALNGIEDRINAIRSQLEDDKEGSLKDLMKKAQDAMEQAKKDTERAAENKKKMENFKKLGEALQNAIRGSAKVQHPTAFTDALDALNQYSKLFEKVRESTGKSVDTLFEEEWFTSGAAAIAATLKKVQEAVKNAVPIPPSSSYSSGNPSLYQTYSGPTPRRKGSSSSNSKSGAVSKKKRGRAVYRRGGRVRN